MRQEDCQFMGECWSRCLGPAEGRPTARELLDDPFLGRRVVKSDSAKMVPARVRSSDQGDFHSAPSSEAGDLSHVAHGHSSEHESHASTNHRYSHVASSSFAICSSAKHKCHQIGVVMNISSLADYSR